MTRVSGQTGYRPLSSLIVHSKSSMGEWRRHSRFVGLSHKFRDYICPPAREKPYSYSWLGRRTRKRRRRIFPFCEACYYVPKLVQGFASSLHVLLARKELLRVFWWRFNPQEEKINPQEEKINLQEEKMNLQDENETQHPEITNRKPLAPPDG